MELQNELLKKANRKEEYGKLAQRIFNLRDKKQSIMLDNAERKGFVKRIGELEKFLDKPLRMENEYDEQLVRIYIEKITVYEKWF